MITYPANLQHLSRLGGPARSATGTIPCLALAHNEANIIGAFLDHYRALGPVSFIIVDDHSTDGTREFLQSQPDVTLYQPRPGSTYSRDKRAWRSEILDACADGRWCLVSDIDEHLVYRDMANTPLQSLIAELEREGAEALLCVMVDMYADKPLAEHEFKGGSLREAFPLFDRIEKQNYRFLMPPSRFAEKYPTPPRFVTGGLVERLFSDPNKKPPTPLARYFLKRYADLSTPHNLSTSGRMMNRLARILLKNHLPPLPLDLTKLALLRWHKGMQFSGGSHATNRPMRLSEKRGVMLHYRFTRGAEGIRYLAERGQHAEGGAYYARFLDEKMTSRSPAGPLTSTYGGETSLGDLLR